MERYFYHPRIFLLGLILLAAALGSAGASTIVLNITAPAYNSLPQGGVMPLNYSDSVIVNVMSSNTGSVMQSYLITAPAIRTQTTNVIVNHTVYVANAVSISNTIALQSCGATQDYINGSIFFTAIAPPCLNISIFAALSPNSTGYVYSNTLYGNKVNFSASSNFSLNRRVNLSLGDSVSLPPYYNYTVFAPSANAMLSNRTSMDILASALASQGCAKGGMVNFWDNATQRNVTVCTRFSNSSFANPFMLMLPFANITNRSVEGLGQGFAQALTLVNQSNNQCHVQLKYAQNQSWYWHQNATACLNNYNQKLQEDASGSSILTIVAVSVISVIVSGTLVAISVMYVHKKRTDRKEGRQ